MFVILSKIVVVFLSPMVWSVLLILCGILNWKKQFSKKFVLAGLLILFIFSNGFIFQLVIQRWEKPAQSAPGSQGSPKLAVVLGGLAEWDKTNGKLVFYEASGRLLHSLVLLKMSNVEKLIISGGDGSPFSEAQKIKEYAVKIGFPDSMVVAENHSKNTYQNALLTSELFAQHHWPKKIVLVTSAFHLPRAISCFEKQGFEVMPFATHPLRKINSLSPADYLLPNPDILNKWNLLIKEWVGILSYKIMGYI